MYLYSKGKYDQINLAASQIKWYDLLCDKTVDQQWMTFKELYEKFVEKYIPVKFVKQGQRSKPPWKRYISGLKANKIQRKAFIKARQTGLYCHKTLREQQSQLVKSALIKAKANYDNKLVDLIKTDPKKFYNYVIHYFRSSSTVESLQSMNQWSRMMLKKLIF